ncbi:MAG: ribosome silencing factor [Bacteroidetes bacterium]|nr:ribosome silencing factor [Bacteroidota bacterium]MDA1120973.1 ribosome silencing factor [Bacteroidota bacterium]
MHKKNGAIPSSQLKDLVVKGMLEKKAWEIRVLDLREVKNAIADYFIVCSGSSDTQIEAIADSLEDEVYKGIGEHPWQKEGKQIKEWILVDYVDVVAHVFSKSKREFYSLEDLWGDAEITEVEESFAN